MNNQTQCNIKEPHSHLVAGQTFECEKGQPDCSICGRKGGHIMPIQDKSVKQYQEDIEAGVDVGKSTHNLCKSTHNLPKSKELKRHICQYNDGKQSCDCFIKGQKAENKAWLKGERCHSCGKYMEPQRMTNICPTCWENN